MSVDSLSPPIFSQGTQLSPPPGAPGSRVSLGDPARMSLPTSAVAHAALTSSSTASLGSLATASSSSSSSSLGGGGTSSASLSSSSSSSDPRSILEKEIEELRKQREEIDARIRELHEQWRKMNATETTPIKRTGSSTPLRRSTSSTSHPAQKRKPADDPTDLPREKQLMTSRGTDTSEKAESGKRTSSSSSTRKKSSHTRGHCAAALAKALGSS